jgi:hypothetical protein
MIKKQKELYLHSILKLTLVQFLDLPYAVHVVMCGGLEGPAAFCRSCTRGCQKKLHQMLPRVCSTRSQESHNFVNDQQLGEQ